MKIAINGFGRIGRQAYKIALEKGIEVAAINDLAPADHLAHLLKYDTVYGMYTGEVKAYVDGQEFIAGSNNLLGIEINSETTQRIVVDGRETRVLSIKDPADLPWRELGVDVVLECTGLFVKDDSAQGHIIAGAKHVVISAPSKGASAAPTYVIGANNENYQNEGIISNASCTTNCISPITRVMQQYFGIEKAIMTTAHGYTSTQNLVDGLNKDLRRGRAAAQNMIPTSTGAAVATTEAIPSLTGKFDGVAIRVPVIAGSLSDVTYLLSRNVTVEEVNNAFREASQTDYYKNIIAVSEAPLVSSDIIGRPESAIVDLPMTRVVGGDLVKVMAWYDNEHGYSNRLVETAEKIIAQQQ